MLRNSFEDTPVEVVDTDSVHEAKEILANNPAVRIVLLDNGLQHLPLERDFDILTINAVAPFGNGHLRPRGTLREPYRSALKRTDSVVLHHVDIAGPERLAATLGTIGPLLPRHVLQTQTQMAPVSLRSLVGHQRSLDMSEFQHLGDCLPLSRLHNAAVVCLTGVGSPATVEQHLKQLGALHVEGCGAHEDHHMFSLEEVEEAVARVRQLVADPAFSHACILLTPKDYARQYDLWSSVFSRYAGEVYTNGDDHDDSVAVPGGGGEGEEESAGQAAKAKWGAYILNSNLQVVKHDQRFSSQKAVLSVMLRSAIDNFRRRSYMGVD